MFICQGAFGGRENSTVLNRLLEKFTIRSPAVLARGLSCVMQRCGFEVIEVSGDPGCLPITIRQTNSKMAKLPGLLLMTALAGLIVLPQLGFAVYALTSADVRRALVSNPVVAIELALALVFWVGLIIWPLRNILIALISSRLVDIREGSVKVVDRTPFSTTLWDMPLASFEGVALHTRTSLSGVRQEAVLVHPNKNRSIILMAADRIGGTEFDRLCQALSLPVVSAGRLYDLGDKPRERQNAVAA
ncbi:conserved protein of unknown function [Hyphomicrobium sp. MC1]|nr:conserved protein of unknown function [Hyphomicrobium sp. MC1]